MLQIHYLLITHLERTNMKDVHVCQLTSVQLMTLLAGKTKETVSPFLLLKNLSNLGISQMYNVKFTYYPFKNYGIRHT